MDISTTLQWRILLLLHLYLVKLLTLVPAAVFTTFAGKWGGVFDPQGLEHVGTKIQRLSHIFGVELLHDANVRQKSKMAIADFWNVYRANLGPVSSGTRFQYRRKFAGFFPSVS